MKITLIDKIKLYNSKLYPIYSGWGWDGNGQKISNVDDPTLAQDAATKNYVDLAIAALPEYLFFKGTIAVAADFPTVALVTEGWTYRVTANVTDNDPAKTNTGLSFIAGDEIAWTGSTWCELGSTAIWQRVGTLISPYNANDSLDIGTGRYYGGFSGQIFYVDGSRADTYTENGSITNPYKKVSDAITAVKALYTAAVDKQTTCYTLKIAPGTYSDAFEITTMKHLRFEGIGVILSGAITLTQSPIGGAGQEPYTRIEFVGHDGIRAEKGSGMTIVGNISGTRTNDSLTYINFRGCWVRGNQLYDTDGTWVTHYENCRVDGTIATGVFADPDSAVLIETTGWNEFSGAITDKVSFYNVTNTDFYSAINITPNFECRFTNCNFINPCSVSIVAVKNLYIDANSYRSMLARVPTLTGMTLVHIDQIRNHNLAEAVDVTKGGTNLTGCALGDTLYGSAVNTYSVLVGNITATKKFLSMTGDGANAAPPTWETVTKTDVGLSNVENTALSTWVGSANITTLGTIGTGTWQGTTIKANYLQNAAADLGATDVNINLSNSNGAYVTNLTIDGAFVGASMQSGTQYFGDPTVDGTWKIEIESGDLVIYKRETGSWVEKGRYE